jgi:hypothetical protein
MVRDKALRGPRDGTCPRCATFNWGQSTYCVTCGRKLDEPEPISVPKPEPKPVPQPKPVKR